MLVRDLLDGEVRALKVLLDETAAEGFLREYELLAGLDHPQIVKVFDFGQDVSGLRYFTMEYLQGQVLTKVVESKPDLELIQNIARQLLSALVALHARGILHADIKPHNMYLVGEEGHPQQLKLLDFGLAGQRNAPQAGQRRGTLPYMAPEWFMDREVDFRSDLYSVGVLLYELLTGHPPFYGENPQSLIQRKLSDDVPDVALLRKDCPAPLARLINSLLEREPALRPRNAEDALRSLDGTLQTTGAGITHLSTLPLTGRERLMASSRGVLESVLTSSSGSLQLISGDAGGGKSRILRELKSMIQREGHKVVDARGIDVAGRSPLEQIFYIPYRLESESNQALIARYDAPLQSLFGKTARDPNAAVMTPQQRTGLLDSLASFLLDLATRQPLMLLIDDLHLADPLVLDLLVQLGLRIGKSPLLIFATVETGWIETRPDYQELLERPDVQLSKLDPLNLEDLQALIKEMFGLDNDRKWLSELLLEVSSGNPSLLAEALESLLLSHALRMEQGYWLISETGSHELFQMDAGKLDAAHTGPGSSAAGPSRADALMQRRLSTTTPLEMTLLEAAAVLGREFDEPELLGLVGEAEWARTSLEGLLQKTLLERDAEELEHLRFAQPRLQEHVLQKLPIEQRRALHRRAGEYLLAACGGNVAHPERIQASTVDALARHFLAAADLKTGKTYGLAAAARADAHNAWRQSLGWYQQLLTLAEHHHLPAPLDVSAKVGELYLSLSQYEKGRSVMLPLLDTPLTPDRLWMSASVDPAIFQTHLILQLSQSFRYSADAPQALVMLNRAAPLMPLEDRHVHLRYLEERANVLLLLAEYNESKRVTLEALELTQNSSAPWLLPHKLLLYALLSNLSMVMQRPDEMDEYAARGLALASAERTGLRPQDEYEYYRNYGLLHMLTSVSLQRKGDFGESIQATLRALTHFEKVRDLVYMANCYNNLSVCYYQQGEWSEAIEYAERTLDLSLRIRNDQKRRAALNNLGFMYKDSGQLEKAQQSVEQALRLSHKLNEESAVITALGNLGEIRARQGNTTEAQRLYEQAIELARVHQAHGEVVENLRRMAELAVDENRLTRARRDLQEGLEIARREGMKIEEGNLLAVQGAEAAQRNLTDRALACFRQGEEILKEQKAEIERARLKHRMGLAYSRLGFPSEAENALRMAEEIFRRLGATWDLRRTREALHRLGGDAGGGGLAFKKLQLLLDVTRTLGAELDLESLLNRLLDRALELTQTERGYVILVDEKGAPDFYSTRHIARDEVERGETSQISSTVIQRVMNERRALAITNIDQELELKAQASIVALGLRSIMCAPLIRGDKVLGVIYVDSSRIAESFYQADVSLLEALADAAAIALENAQLVTSLRRKTDLMSILAHEFRSPLSASIIFTQQLLRDPNRVNDEQREGLEGILEQSFRLSRMINNILELARMEANRVEWWMEEVQMAQVLTSTVRGLEPLAKEKHVRISLRPVPEKAVVYGNTDRLIQVCTNLLGNALKFTPERGTVELSVEIVDTVKPLITKGSRPVNDSWSTRNLGASRKVSETAYLTVRFADTGPGIPLEDLERIFGQFAQTGPVHMRSQGTGLGLTIAREIVLQHGGRLWAENASGGGAMFIFSLPLVV